MHRHGPRYLRFAALGDSTTVGIGDPVEGGWRGWARLLCDALATSYEVSYCNLSVSGATAASVHSDQLAEAVAHRPDLASLIVGVNDTMRSTWDPVRMRDQLLQCAAALNGAGAMLLTVRFHDHGSVLGLPRWLRRPMFARIEQVNAIYDEMYQTYGGLRVDLAQCAEIATREFWSIDRLHPSELGHRALARRYAYLLAAQGLGCEPPSAQREGGYVPDWRSDLRWMVTAGAPWVGRRARDLGPWAFRMALAEATARRGPVVVEEVGVA